MIKPLPELEALQKKYFEAIDEAFKAKTVLGEDYFEEMRKDLIDRYRIEREQLKKKAIIPDKNIDYITKLQIYELTPHRCGFLYLKINEARNLLNRETDVEDRSELDLRWEAVEQREEELYPPEPEKPEEAPKKPSFLKRLFKRNHKEPEPEQPEVIQICTAVQETPGSDSTYAPGTPAQPSDTSTAARGASDATHQSDGEAKKTAELQLEKIIAQADNATLEEAFTEPEPHAPPPPSEEPKKSKGKKKQARTPREPNAAPPAPEQLAGQINIDEITPAQVVERPTT